MLADLLKKDIRQYAARGVVFTPEDIVRLNALAVRVKLAQHPCQGVHLPRCVFMPPASFFGRALVLREPTIAHELWLEQAAQWIDVADERNFLFLHAFALSVADVDSLPDAFDGRAVVKAVFRFAVKRLVRYTAEQLRNVVDYALYGADWTCGEAAVPKGEGKDEGEESLDLNLKPSPPSPTIGLITRARALRLPISLDDARRMTASELAEAVAEALDGDEKLDVKQARHNAMGDYVRTRDAIIARIKAEKEKGHGCGK